MLEMEKITVKVSLAQSLIVISTNSFMCSASKRVVFVLVVVCFGWADLREKNQEPIAEEEPLEDIVSSIVLGSGLGMLLEPFMFWLKIGVVLCVVLLENCRSLGPLLLVARQLSCRLFFG